MTADHPERSTEAFFGRRRGKRLRPHQRATLEALLPRLKLDLDSPAPTDIRTLFAHPVTDVRLEIGFGGGEHLLAELERYPDRGFIGVEPFVNGMAKLLSALEGTAPVNLRLYDDDATALLDWLPAASLSGVDLLYPDPWPKKKHWKRRFVGPANLDRLARVMKPGAVFRFASDIDTYVNWTLLHCRAHPAFAWEAESAEDWRQPYEGWPSTRYEAKAMREGRTPAYLTFIRVKAD
ncbi:tRNA (guanine(46)-N(7))-methyltransferase TrmB [Chelativorans salis]|uniref:tRNA (guanine-N(7)-)-methyltransferase n=1 Tax=Chelativorans salis TaxID=2978478 RepID=A0ABT2LVP9_9HYPH|nr:tRNA (guanosine(46)-N(7))-methyltransferase TrmB [Chelativorans sp. EGI FJ00035]MCT7378608.1 tRNA (guanosine(46)-N(7))-methyltransferase TrmB [Chelativorans sp. EGI FJ00035]